MSLFDLKQHGDLSSARGSWRPEERDPVDRVNNAVRLSRRAMSKAAVGEAARAQEMGEPTSPPAVMTKVMLDKESMKKVVQKNRELDLVDGILKKYAACSFLCWSWEVNHARWFRLDPKMGSLSYWKKQSKQGGAPVRCLQLEDLVDLQTNVKLLTIRLTFEGLSKKLWLTASSDDELDRWMTVLDQYNPVRQHKVHFPDEEGEDEHQPVSKTTTAKSFEWTPSEEARRRSRKEHEDADGHPSGNADDRPMSRRPSERSQRSKRGDGEDMLRRPSRRVDDEDARRPSKRGADSRRPSKRAPGEEEPRRKSEYSRV